MAKIVGELKARLGLDKKKFDKGVKGAEKKTNKLAQTAKKLGGALAAAFGVKQIFKFISASAKAYDVQIQAERKLEAAIRANGGAVAGNIEEYKKWASELQNISTVGDETTLNMLSVAQSMGVTGDAAKVAVKEAVALGKAMGMNVNSAIRYTAALQSGNSTMLARYLPTLREIDDEAGRTAKAHELLGNMFSQVTEEAKTGLGPLKQLGNLSGDLKEQIGELVINTDAFGGSVGFFTKRVEEAIEEVSAFNQLMGSDWMKDEASWIERTALKLAKFTKGGKEAAAMMNESLETERLFNAIRDTAADTIEREEAVIRLLTYQLDILKDKESEEAQALRDSIATYEKSIEMRKKLKDVTEEQVTSLGSLEEKLKTQKDHLKGINVANKEAFADQIAKILATEAEIESVNRLIEKLRELEDVRKGFGRDTEAPEKIEGRTEIGLEGTADKDFLDGLEKRLADTQKYTDKMSALYEKLKQEQIQKDREAAEEKQSIQDATFEAASHILTGLGNMFAAQKEKELSMVGDNAKKRAEIEKKYAQREKAISIGQAIINTAVAVTKALTAAPPPFNAILAATVAASGAAQVAMISAQKFADGGIVPGGYPNDTYPALLSSHERVLTPKQNQAFEKGMNIKVSGGFTVSKGELRLAIREAMRQEKNSY